MNLTEYNIERDSSARSEMLSKSGGRSGVPLIDIEGIIMRGFSSQELDEAVKQRQRS
ncbi:MAG: hypothetical protein ACLPN1_13440 [Dissulfurispiraceae bacterium]